MAATDGMSPEEAYGLREWGRQTIFYLMFFRDQPEWLAMTDQQRIDLAEQAAEAIAEGFWRDTNIECANTPALFAKVFSRQILKVVANRLSD